MFPSPESLLELEDHRLRGMEGTGASPEGSCLPHRFDLQTLPVDFVECLMRFLPTEAEVKLLRQYERERQPLEELAAEDRFMLLFSKVERLTQRMAGMAFLGNFQDNLQMLTPVRLPQVAISAAAPPPSACQSFRYPPLPPSQCGVTEVSMLPSSNSMPSSRPLPRSSPRRS